MALIEMAVRLKLLYSCIFFFCLIAIDRLDSSVGLNRAELRQTVA